VFNNINMKSTYLIFSPDQINKSCILSFILLVSSFDIEAKMNNVYIKVCMALRLTSLGGCWPSVKEGKPDPDLSWLSCGCSLWQEDSWELMLAGNYMKIY